MVEMAKNGGSHRVTTQSMGEVPGSRLFRATDADALNGMAQQYPQMTLSQRIGVVEINTLWLFRYLQLAKKRTKIVSFHRLSVSLIVSGTGMTSLIHLSPLLKCLMTVCPSSLHSCVQGTNFSPIRTPW